ncbi:MAG: hypothetical protein FWE45_04245 [Firmicutes bacterium]|nr:hypothetical protein [Bacillota bacterium]
MINLLNNDDIPERYGPIQAIAEWIGDHAWDMVGIALIIVGALAVVYAIYLGVKLATATDENSRKQAKLRIVWAIMAVIITFSLIMVFTQLDGMIEWGGGSDGPPGPPDNSGGTGEIW